MLKYIRRQGWHAICALKSNRKLNGIRIDHQDRQLKHKQYTRVWMTAADGRPRSYLVRTLRGRLQNVPFDVCVLISRRHYRDKNPKVFLCTDLKLSPQKALTWYGNRWPLEVDYWYLKQALGLGDFRMQAYEAIEKWYALVHLALTFLQWRLYQAQARGQPLRSVADVIRQHRAEHAHSILIAACREALQSGDMEPVLQRFISMPLVT